MNISTHLYDIAELHGGRYTLRAIETSDAQDIYAYARLPKVTKYLLWSPHENLNDTLRYIQLTAELNECRKNLDWAIVDEETGRVIGAVGLVARSADGANMELGYVLHPDHWNSGIMTVAARLACDYVFSATTCQRIYAEHFVENAASGRVLEKIGMQKEGVLRHARQQGEIWRDVAHYSMLREDWEKMQPKDRGIGLEKLRNVKCVALDMDGTIYLGERVLPGAFDLMDVLKRKGIRPVFLTNNSSRSVSHYVKRLNGMGFSVTEEDILSSGQAAAAYLTEHFPDKRVFVMGNSNLVEELERFGIHVVEDGAEVVLAGFDTTLTYERLTKTCDYVRAGLPFIATHPDFNCPVDGGFIPDLGAMLDLIEASAFRRPDLIIGKPYGEIARYLEKRTGFSGEEIAMVGDRLYTDVATGVNYGMVSILVLSGETKESQLFASTIQPDLVLSGVDELAQILTEFE